MKSTIHPTFWQRLRLFFNLENNQQELDATAYLLKSPANRARLLKSIEDYNNGLGEERNLIEE
ncbi:hypothetical protein BH09BAC6_BH09BAC6_14390 [soil metagenome]|jgi:hypothetical protein